ncbi:MAG: YXWGXW repeat-containing protein [Gammaproteobacteria bacterium]|nr:YXWGXW repeat-containing protein [Gammaproteobacteria bacterium]
MFKVSIDLRTGLAPLVGLVLTCAAASQLAGCVVAPPPRVVYAPPPAPPPAPAPAYAAHADDADVQASEPPPPLPVYEQPACPVEGYLWTPGYWAWGIGGYYWVPGTWVAPPRVGLLWTPGYWGFVGGVYMFHAGYWGPHVGFYGGVNYGFGYVGVGFGGGRWVGNSFAYNQSVTNVNVTVVHNTYNETVINNNVTVNRVSYNGGAGGTVATPTPQEKMAAQEQHVPPTVAQHQHVQQAAANPSLLAKNNGGRPAIAATPHAAAFNAPGVVGAHGAAAPPPQHAPAVANANHNLAEPAGQANGTHAVANTQQHAQPAPAANQQKPAAHPQVANARQQGAPKKNASKPHQKPENAKREGHEGESAQRR